MGESGTVDAAGILAGQDVRDVSDVVGKFTGAPGVPGVTSPTGASFSEWGPLYDRSDPGQGRNPLAGIVDG